MPANHTEIEKRLWDAADELRANSKLKSSEYAVPVLGLIFLRYADHKFGLAEAELRGTATPATASGAVPAGRRAVGKTDYQARGVLYLPAQSRFAALLAVPEGADIGKAINEAMKGIEEANAELKDVLPKTYNRLDAATLFALLKNFHSIPMDIEGDAFGKIYEYFLGKFAMSEGQKGGEFFTPTALVKLLVEIIEPYHGRILDPAGGSGGMFVQSARFVAEHKHKPSDELSIFGQEKVAETVRLCKMNLAVHGLSGDIRQANTYYEDLHRAIARFDFVMANPPFNVDKVDKERLKDDTARFPFGMPRADNANYLWIQIFYSALNEHGRAGFVMANSAADARGSEQEIRQKLIESRAVDVMVAIGPNFFYTVTLPCTLWFLDRGKLSLTPAPSTSAQYAEQAARRGEPSRPKSFGVGGSIARLSRRAKGDGMRGADTVLFVDARHIFRQIDRAHREFTPEQIAFLAGLVRLYRGEPQNGYTFTAGGIGLTDSQAQILQAAFKNQRYADVPGLCKTATVAEIEAQGWSLNPGRYVGVAEREQDDFDFKERLEEMNEELEVLNGEARELEDRIAENVAGLL